MQVVYTERVCIREGGSRSFGQDVVCWPSAAGGAGARVVWWCTHHSSALRSMAPSRCCAGAPGAAWSCPAACVPSVSAAIRAWKAAASNGLLNQEGAGVPGSTAAAASLPAAAVAAALLLLLLLLGGWVLAESTSSHTRACPVE